MNPVSFADTAIVACGVMNMELSQLQTEGFLDTSQILYTTPGLHQNVRELENQLVRQITKAKSRTEKVIVVYGGKYCYVNTEQPTRLMNTIIQEQGPGVVRVKATHCMDMVADEAQRHQIAAELAGGEPVWWMTPGWIKYRTEVFKGWDKSIANENFPRHTGGAVVLDAIGYLDTYMAENPEAFLEYADWMGIPIVAYPVTLDHFKSLLIDAANAL